MAKRRLLGCRGLRAKMTKPSRVMATEHRISTIRSADIHRFSVKHKLLKYIIPEQVKVPLLQLSSMMCKMISQFPAFCKLGIEHQDEINQITSRYEPYSDFNFTSLFCWDVDDTTEISLLNGNLVIRLPDYITGEPIYSLLGENQVDESLKDLLELTDSLSLVPSVTVAAIQSHEFKVTEDPDNFDYIYSLQDLVDFAGKKYKVKRNKTNQFMRNYEASLHLRNIQFSSKADREIAKAVFLKWAQERNRDENEIQNELLAIARVLEYSPDLNLTGVLVYIDQECVGFSINEIIDKEYSICHFQKALLEYEHLDVFISNLVAKELLHFGCTYVNWEQDLGIEGLRQLKSSYQEYSFLKKYKVSSLK